MIELTSYRLRIPEVVAKKFASPDSHLHDDLVSVGYVGLVVASRNYEEGRGASKDAHLFRWVRGYMLNYLNQQKRMRKSSRAAIVEYLRCRAGEVSSEGLLEATDVWKALMDRLDPITASVVKQRYVGCASLKGIHGAGPDRAASCLRKAHIIARRLIGEP